LNTIECFGKIWVFSEQMLPKQFNNRKFFKNIPSFYCDIFAIRLDKIMLHNNIKTCVGSGILYGFGKH